MKKQILTGCEKYAKTTRRTKFLGDMDWIIPWLEMTAAVVKVYPKIREQGGRRGIDLGVEGTTMTGIMADTSECPQAWVTWQKS